MILLCLIICLLFIGIFLFTYLIIKIKTEKFTYLKGKKSKLIQYLKSVYPLTNWDKISNDKVEKFYDLLGFVYNPCSEYLKKDLSGNNNNCYDTNSNTYGKRVCGTTWNSLDICKSFYPYRPPKGWLLSFKDYHEKNQHSVYSDGTRNIKEMTSYRQTLHWGVSSTGGEISRTCRSGPGPYWLTTFSIVRDYYYPNGIKFKDGTWTIKCNMSSALKNHGCEWNYPNNWTDGFKEGEYIEVSHSQNNPGMTQSVGFWFNGLPGGGTGIFLKIGRTHIANNKIDVLYTLFEKLKNSSSSDLYASMRNTKFVGKSGSDIMKFYYNTDDIDDIVWGYANGKWGVMSYTADGKNPLVNPSDNMWKWIGNKGILSASGLMTEDKIAVTGFDGEGYKPNLNVNFSKVAYWWLEQKGITGGLTKKNKRYILNAARNPEKDIDYFPNRAGGMVPPDEPICWLSFVLGIETIQMPMSANDNGLWVYEIIDLRFPTPENTPGFPSKYKNWSNLCKERIYGWINNGYNNSDSKSGSGFSPGFNFGPIWNPDAQRWWMVHIQKFLSSRDPLNIKNGINCDNIGYIYGLTKNECNNPFSNVPNVPGVSSKGYFDEEKRCWVAIDEGGWQNIPCIPGTIQQQYIKIPLMYP